MTEAPRRRSEPSEKHQAQIRRARREGLTRASTRHARAGQARGTRARTRGGRVRLRSLCEQRRAGDPAAMRKAPGEPRAHPRAAGLLRRHFASSRACGCARLGSEISPAAGAPPPRDAAEDDSLPSCVVHVDEGSVESLRDREDASFTALRARIVALTAEKAKSEAARRADPERSPWQPSTSELNSHELWGSTLTPPAGFCSSGSAARADGVMPS